VLRTAIEAREGFLFNHTGDGWRFNIKELYIVIAAGHIRTRPALTTSWRKLNAGL